MPEKAPSEDKRHEKNSASKATLALMPPWMKAEWQLPLMPQRRRPWQEPRNDFESAEAKLNL